VIHLYDTLLRNLGVGDYELELNSIGDRNCRPAYVETLSAWLADREDELDADTREKLRTSPLRALDNIAAKPPHVQDVLREAPAIGDSLCEACVSHFAEVRALLDELGVAYTLVPTLVRGLDYYTRTTWEFIGPLAGANSTISGGGRYDGLIEEIGGPPTPGVGFGAGIERLLLALEDAGITAEPPRLDVFLAVEADGPRALALRWLRDLRAAGVAADTDYAGRSLKGQLTQAGRSGAHTTVIVGAEGATLRRQGQQDEPLAHADVVGTLLR
jgi:histidyl-tRNA synthetase